MPELIEPIETQKVQQQTITFRFGPVLYTTGYLTRGTFSGKDKIKTFDAMVRRAGLLVFDIRLNPWSMAPCWRKAELCDRLGNAQTFPDGRYLHVPALGNVNYRTGEEIQIQNLAFGIDTVMESCRITGLSPLLLCGCPDYESCHRSVVGEAFAGHARRWCEITHWNNPADNGRGDSADLFGDELTERWVV